LRLGDGGGGRGGGLGLGSWCGGENISSWAGSAKVVAEEVMVLTPESILPGWFRSEAITLGVV